MKYIHVLLLLIVIFSCENDSDNIVPDEFKFNLNIHNSLNSTWQNEFNIILNNLKEIIPVEPYNYFYELDIYAWNDNVSNPFKNEIGNYSGACICGNSKEIFMVLEIPNNEFLYNSMHRYSVIAHEYFHAYQMSLSKNFFDNDIELKWMSEGGAATFESLYIQYFYNKNYFLEAQTNIDEYVKSNPSIYEKYNSSSSVDMNYASSVFMFLVLSKELQKLNFSEEESFRLILKDFWETNPSNGNWKNKFEEVFNMNVDDFYNKIKNYNIDINEVQPSNNLDLKNIFKN